MYSTTTIYDCIIYKISDKHNKGYTLRYVLFAHSSKLKRKSEILFRGQKKGQFNNNNKKNTGIIVSKLWTQQQAQYN